MPVYEYRCRQCERDFEHLVRGPSDLNDLVCPHCRSGSVEKRVSVFAAGHAESASPSAGPCARCGDPNGPCSFGG